MLVAEKYAYLEEMVPVAEPVRREAPSRQEKPRQVPVRKHQTLNKFLTLSMVLICFAAASFIVFRYALISENHRAILALEKTLEQEKIRKEKLEVELSYCKDLNTIEFLAAELGMKYPGEGQVQYVSLPEPDEGMEQAEAPVDSGKSIWSRLLGIFN
ncbi:MAG TPA: hypothetical protein GX505_08455 [Clostridiales bacterium]|nr:hypothetical protein [Clostridiales bacterium]